MNAPRLEDALAQAERLGAAAADLVHVRESELSVQVAKGEVENLTLAESIGVGARVITRDRRMGFAYATQLDDLERIVEQAWHNAQHNEPDEHNVLLDDAQVSDDDWTDDGPGAFARISTEDKVALAKRLERLTRDADPRIEDVPQSSYGESAWEIALVNSAGARRRFRSAAGSCSVSAKAARPGADPESGWEFQFAQAFDALDAEWVSAHCAEKALRRLGAEPCETARMAIVFDNYVASQFLGVLVPALRADSVLKGKSLYAGCVGERISGEALSILDRNDHPDGLHRSPFDAEGAPAQTTPLLERGVLRGYLHNAYTAHRMGVATTGNAVRGGFRSTPEVGATNCWIAPGTASQAELLRRVGDGLFITDAMGVHAADPISGDFSFGVGGLLIRNGALDRPVRGVTVAGNIKDLLLDVRAAGDDLRFFGSCGAPSLWVDGLMVSGK